MNKNFIIEEFSPSEAGWKQLTENYRADAKSYFLSILRNTVYCPQTYYFGIFFSLIFFNFTSLTVIRLLCIAFTLSIFITWNISFYEMKTTWLADGKHLSNYLLSHKPESNFWVIIDRKLRPHRIIASIGVHKHRNREKDAEICRLFVLKDYRQKGLGRKLLHFAMEYCKKIGYVRAHVEVYKSYRNHDLETFYRCSGFRYEKFFLMPSFFFAYHFVKSYVIDLSSWSPK